MKTYKQKYQDLEGWNKSLQISYINKINELKELNNNLSDALSSGKYTTDQLVLMGTYESFIEQLYHYLTNDKEYMVRQEIFNMRAGIMLRKELNRT